MVSTRNFDRQKVYLKTLSFSDTTIPGTLVDRSVPKKVFLLRHRHTRYFNRQKCTEESFPFRISPYPER